MSTQNSTLENPRITSQFNAISISDFHKYGCPYCGYRYATTDENDGTTKALYCDRCTKLFFAVHNEIAIYGSRANPNVSWKIIEAIAAGRLVVSDLISHVFPLDDFAQALSTFVERKDGAVKVVIEPNGPEVGRR